MRALGYGYWLVNISASLRHECEADANKFLFKFEKQEQIYYILRPYLNGKISLVPP